MKRDITEEGRKTTIGVAQFAMFNANMTHLQVEDAGNEDDSDVDSDEEPTTRKTGRPRKVVLHSQTKLVLKGLACRFARENVVDVL